MITDKQKITYLLLAGWNHWEIQPANKGWYLPLCTKDPKAHFLTLEQAFEYEKQRITKFGSRTKQIQVSS